MRGAKTRRDYVPHILEGENKAVVKTHEVAIISPQELLYFIEKTGFVKVQTYSSYDARASELITDRLIMISAQKPGLS